MTRRGGGHLYQRGAVYWMKFYVNGRPVYESTKQTGEKAAQRVLNDRLGRVARGEPMLPRADRVMYLEAAKDLRTHYTASGERDTDEAGYRLTHLDAFFRHYRLVQIQPAVIADYVVKRQEQGAANGTINRELAVLGRMLKLAYENGKLLRMPVLRKVKEADPRAGFFEPEQFQAVRSGLPPELDAAALIAYTYGWRMQSEVLTLERRQVDLPAGTLRLDPGQTKNGEGRLVYLAAEIAIALQAQLARVAALERVTKQAVPYLFPHMRGKRAGQRRADFRKAWATACDTAGLASKIEKDGRTIIRPMHIRHDFRRTAVRNMVNAGVPERVAMKITGHKTRAVFDRYHIVSPADLQAAARRLDGDNHGDNRHVALETSPVTV